MNFTPIPLALLTAAATFAQQPDEPLPSAPVRVYEARPASLWYWDGTRADTATPSAIPYARMLADGQWSFGYTYEQSSYDGLRDGRDDLSRQDVFGDDYRIAPRELNVQAHMFELRYGFTDHVTGFARLPYLRKELDSRVRGGGDFETQTEGIGDLVIGVVHSLHEGDQDQLLVNIGLGIPIGSFDETDRDENGERRVAPYVTQLGTGTFDLYPGVTWTVQEEFCTWGISGQGRIHIGENSDDWAVSDSLHASAWVTRPWTDRLSGTLRLESASWGDYHGGNEDFAPRRNPLEDDNRQGGARITIFGGLSYEFAKESYTTNRIELEVGVPVDEWLDGPQLSAEYSVLFGWHISL